MEQAALRPQRPQENRAPSVHVPRYVLAGLVVWFSFAVASLGVWGLGRLAIPPSNPFASFADIFPGQPRSILDAYGFSCVMTSFPDSKGAPNEHCTLNPASGVFSQVTVGIYSDTIQSVWFTLHENTLKVGDLMLLWGKGIVRANSISSYWHSGNIIATGINGTEHFSLFLPVENVFIQPVPPSAS